MPAQIDWRDELFTLLARASSWQSPGDALKRSVSEIVGRWIGGDNAELAAAVTEALQDGRVTETDLRDVLLAVAKSYAPKCPLGQPFAEALIADLSDGRLDSEEIAALAAMWVASRTREEALRKLIEAAATGQLTSSDIAAAIIQWLRDHDHGAEADALEAALNDPAALTPRTLALLIVAYLVNRRGLAGEIGTTPAQWRAAVLTALGNLTDPEVVQILVAMAEGRGGEAARLVLAKLGITSDEAVVTALLAGNLEPLLRERLTERLTRAIAGITDEQASALAAEVICLLKGGDKLIPTQAEQEALGLGDWEYGIWQRTRQVLYAAKLAAEGGPVVPTDPMARPHVFAAAAIGADTVVKTLVGESLWGYLLDYIALFSVAEFGESIRVVPIDREGMVEEEKTAFSVHLHIAAQLC